MEFKKVIEITLNRKNLIGNKIFLPTIEEDCIYSFPKKGFITSQNFRTKSIYTENKHFLNIKHLSKTEEEARKNLGEVLHDSSSRFGFEETQWGFGDTFSKEGSGLSCNVVQGSCSQIEDVSMGSSFLTSSESLSSKTGGAFGRDKDENRLVKFDLSDTSQPLPKAHENFVSNIDHLPFHSSDESRGCCENFITSHEVGSVDKEMNTEDLVDVRAKLYNNYFMTHVSNPWTLGDSKPDILENIRIGNHFKDGKSNCKSFNAFMKRLCLCERPQLVKDAIDFEARLIYIDNPSLFMKREDNKGNYSTYEVPLLDYLLQDDLDLSEPIFDKGMVTVDKVSILKMGIKSFKDKCLSLFEVSVLPPKSRDQVETLPPSFQPTVPMTPWIFPFEWDAMKKRNKSNAFNPNSSIVLTPSLRPSLKEAFESSLLPPCGMYILEQIVNFKRATYPIRGAMAVIFDLGFKEEEILGFMEENIYTPDQRDKEDEISSVKDQILNKWKYQSTSIRSLYPDFEFPEVPKGKEERIKKLTDSKFKTNTCGKGCKGMVTNPIYSDKEGVSQCYACPLVMPKEIKKYEGLVDIEDLVEISKKGLKTVKDVSVVTSKCRQIMAKKRGWEGKKGVGERYSRMPYEVYLAQLIRLEE
jgi:hypothetical protein